MPFFELLAVAVWTVVLVRMGWLLSHPRAQRAQRAADREARGLAEVVGAGLEGKAEDGKISVKAPGLDFSFSVPKGIADNMKADTDSEILYPGSSIRGIHAVQGAKAQDGVRQGEVEIRFASPDPAGRIAAWYRDPARGEGFAVTSAVRQGAGYVLAGTTRREGDGFKLHLAPAGGGGTDGRLIVRDRN